MIWNETVGNSLHPSALFSGLLFNVYFIGRRSPSGLFRLDEINNIKRHDKQSFRISTDGRQSRRQSTNAPEEFNWR